MLLFLVMPVLLLFFLQILLELLHECHLLGELFRVLFDLVRIEDVLAASINVTRLVSTVVSLSLTCLSLDIVKVGRARGQYNFCAIIEIYSSSSVHKKITETVLGGIIDPFSDPYVLHRLPSTHRNATFQSRLFLAHGGFSTIASQDHGIPAYTRDVISVETA